MTSFDIAIIGGGVVGCAIARELSRYDLNIALFEKELDVAEGISKANSGVIHAGFNVKTGSLKAKFNLEGLKYFPEICNELDVPYKLCKKLVVAKNNKELDYLKKLFDQGIKNGCTGLSIIKKNKIKKLEPHINGKYALYSQKTAVINPYLFTIKLAESAFNNGVKYFFDHEVVNIKKWEDNFFILYFKNDCFYKSKIVINSSGMYSDKIAMMIKKHKNKIYPCRGEYYVMDEDASSLLRMAVYPVPPIDGSGLGVHLTPTVNDNILIGPSADYIDDRDDVRNTKSIMEILKKEAFELLPALKNFPFIKNYAGIRPKLFNSITNTNFEDFVIEESVLGFINLVGIESPGLTSAPAIAKYITDKMISEKIELVQKKEFNRNKIESRKTKYLNFSSLKKIYKKDKNYGEIICRCNNITKAEILQAIDNPLKSLSLDAIKKRTQAMMGRCQGGFCLSKIIDLLVNEYNMKPEQIIKGKKNSSLFLRT